MNPEHPDSLPAIFLAQLFSQIPVLVLRLSPEGLVLAANPEAARATGFEVKDLVGRNFWGLLFPGKLFQQVPKFLAGLKDGGSIRDRPMVMATKSGLECVVAWSRFSRKSADDKIVEILCTGIDLTQRLIDADRPSLPEFTVTPNHKNVVHTADHIEGEFVQPLAVSPPKLKNADNKALQEVENYLAMVEQRGNAVYGMLSIQDIPLPTPGRADGHRALLHTDRLFSTAQHAAIGDALHSIQNVLTLCHKGKATKGEKK